MRHKWRLSGLLAGKACLTEQAELIYKTLFDFSFAGGRRKDLLQFSRPHKAEF